MRVDWCRQVFYSLDPEGGVFGIPEGGLIFVRSGSELVLTDRLPWMEGFPLSVEELRGQQEMMYALAKEHFEAAGIPVRRSEGNGH